MQLAFCLFKYYPFGGLERDFLRIAETCAQRGHTIDIYTMYWRGDIPANFNVHLIAVKGISNHSRCKDFASKVQKILLLKNYAVVIGFNRMPGLDIYYAADPCYVTASKLKHKWWYRLTNRYRTYANLERAVFNTEANTQILLLTASEKSNFTNSYGTPSERFTIIPPGIANDRIPPANAHEIRTQLRDEFQISMDEKLVLMIGSDFNRKGVDRALYAVAALPKNISKYVKLFVIGKGDLRAMQKLANNLNIANNVELLGARHDITRFLLSADLLLHPARQETAGMVLLEALVAKLPVLVTDNCGYACYIASAQAGLLISSPFRQIELNTKLFQMLTSNNYQQWKINAATYTKNHDLFSLAEKVADIIEKKGT